MSEPENPKVRSAQTSKCLWLLPLVAAAVWGLFLWQPTALSALTVIPRECWWIGGVGLQLLCLRGWRSRSWRIATMLWLVFAFVMIEPTGTLLRNLRPQTARPPDQQTFRVVSLNAAMGSRQILTDLQRQHPDLVLIQESPSRDVLLEWARILFGDAGQVVWSADSSILARGKLTPLPAPLKSPFVRALWKPLNNREIEVVSLRLWPQPVRFDYWNADCWRSYARVRQIQLQQVQQLRDDLTRTPQHLPIIVGGDFNNPAGDPTDEKLMSVPVFDAYRKVGRGWGKTITNEFPFHRIDRVFLSHELKPILAEVKPTFGSDHRLLRCEFTD